MLRPGEVTAMMRRVEPLLGPYATVLGAQVAGLASGNFALPPLHGDAVVLAHQAMIDLFPPGMMGLPACVGRGARGSGEGRGQAQSRQGQLSASVHDRVLQDVSGEAPRPGASPMLSEPEPVRRSLDRSPMAEPAAGPSRVVRHPR